MTVSLSAFVLAAHTTELGRANRVVDTDYAEGSGHMSKNAVLSRAGIAMTSQANAMPQSVLSDLKQGEFTAESALEKALTVRTELASNALNILNAEASKISALLKTG